MKPHRQGSIEIEEDVPHHFSFFKVQKFAWGLILLLLIAALAGLLGPGPLSRTTRGQKGGPLWLQYDRIVRYHSPAKLVIQSGGNPAPGGEVSLWLSRAFVDSIEIRRLEPEPAAVEQQSDRILYRLKVRPGTDPIRVVIRYEPDTFGPVWGQLGIGESPGLMFRQFSLP